MPPHPAPLPRLFDQVMCGSLLVFGLQQGMTGASPEPGSDVPALTRAATRVTPNHVTPNTSTGAAAASSAGAGVSFGPNADGKRPRRKKKRPQDTIGARRAGHG